MIYSEDKKWFSVDINVKRFHFTNERKKTPSIKPRFSIIDKGTFTVHYRCFRHLGSTAFRFDLRQRWNIKTYLFVQNSLTIIPCRVVIKNIFVAMKMKNSLLLRFRCLHRPHSSQLDVFFHCLCARTFFNIISIIRRLSEFRREFTSLKRTKIETKIAKNESLENILMTKSCT